VVAVSLPQNPKTPESVNKIIKYFKSISLTCLYYVTRKVTWLNKRFKTIYELLHDLVAASFIF
jgi:hypothetical protein